MVAARPVVARVLNELKTRQSDLVERNVIGRPRIAQRNRAEPQVADRPGPLLKNHRSRQVALGKNAQKFSAAVVGVEVGVELRMFGLDRDRARLLAKKFGYHLFFRFGGVGTHSKMVADVSG